MLQVALPLGISWKRQRGLIYAVHVNSAAPVLFSTGVDTELLYAHPSSVPPLQTPASPCSSCFADGRDSIIKILQKQCTWLLNFCWANDLKEAV